MEEASAAIRRSTEKQMSSEALLAMAKENKEKDAVFNVDLREIRKALGITIRNSADQDHRDDIENIANYIKERDIAILRKQKNYPDQVRKYYEKRQTDPEYRKVSEVKTVGMNGRLVEVADKAIDISWKATSAPDGPRWKERYEAWLASLPKGPTEEEIARWAKEKDEKEMWVKIQKGLVMEQHEVVRKVMQDQEIARLKALEDENPEMKKWANDLRSQQNRDNNRFELLRTLPTFTEFKNSMRNWNKGVMERWDSNTGFPKKSSFLPPGVTAGSTVIRDDLGFEVKGTKKERSELYIKHNTGEVFVAYRERILNKMCDRAEQWLIDHKRELIEAEERKEVSILRQYVLLKFFL